MDTASKPLKILLEMRPALAGHAGIPQETRLLFRGLSLIGGFSVEGLIQSSTHTLGRGLPANNPTWWGRLTRDRQINRLARVVISLEQKFWRSHMSVVPAALRRLLGVSEELTRFDALHFRDFIWQRLFARTLPAEDFDIVTSAAFRVARTPWTAMHLCALATRKTGCMIFPRLNTAAFDVMIAETPYPATVSRRTQLIVRYHDAIPLLMPHTISDRRYHQASHYHALRRNVESGAWFVCVSEATRKDLLSIFPQVEARSTTIHNIVSHHYFDESSDRARVREIVRTRLNSSITGSLSSGSRRTLFNEKGLGPAPDYLLIVSTIEPRKNHLALLSAWEMLRAERFPGLKLIVVGALGWHHDRITKKLLPWTERGEVFLLEDVPSGELRLLYKHARATVCPSFAEGFDLSGVESMMSGGAVVASDIAVHREIYADAAEFFNPYCVEDLVRGLGDVISPERTRRRDELLSRGAAVAQRYSCGAILPKWQELLGSRRLARVAA
jgi:glycosyltransferase involved in cell wall biosynthesis